MTERPTRSSNSSPLYDPKIAQQVTEDGRKALKDLIKAAADVIEFDYENCDFGPALGMMIAKRKSLLRQMGNTVAQLGG